MKRNSVVQESVGAVISQENTVYYRLAVYAIVTMLSVLVPRTTVYGGLSPFGVSIAACVDGPACVMVCIGAGLGYILSDTVVMPLRYIAAMICVIGFQWALGMSDKIVKHILYSPILSASSTLVTGVAINSMTGFQWDVFVMQLCEAILAGGFALFFKNVMTVVEDGGFSRSLSLPQQVSLTITVGVILMSLVDVGIDRISVGRVLIMLVILIAAQAGQQHGGTVAGVVFGAATALCTPQYIHFAAGYSFGGMLAGLFSRFGRAVSVMIYLIVNVLIAFGIGDVTIVLISAYESLAASVLFALLPRCVLRAANMVFSRAETLPAAEGVCRSVDMRLTHSADTMRSIAKTVDTVSEKLATMNAPNVKEVFGNVCEQVCNGCKRRETCWKSEFTDTMAEYRRIGDRLRQNGRITKAELSLDFQKNCQHTEQVLSTLNSSYSRFMIKENAYRRLCDIRSIVTDQFEGMASLLSEISDDLRVTQRVDMETAARVERVCDQYRIICLQSLCLLNKEDRMTVELLVDNSVIVPDEKSRFHRELCTACGCELAAPQIIAGETVTKVRWTQKPQFVIHFAGAQLNCHREKLCGDAYESFYDHEGRCCVVLSDGMGSGGRAAVDGAMTTALAGRMLQAGFQFENILRIINSALIVKSGDESLSTLDVIQIDLMSGRLHGIKAGAAPAFIWRDGRVTTIKAASLPIGILRDVDACEYDDVVKKGDVVVMVSDGVVSDDPAPIEELIKSLCSRKADERTMANEIVFYAREHQEKEHTDDTTALVMKVC